MYYIKKKRMVNWNSQLGTHVRGTQVQKIAPYIDEFLVTLSSLIGHTGQVRVSLLTVFSHHAAVIERVFPQEAFRVVVAVNVDLGQSIMGGRLLTAFMDARLEPGQQQLQSVRDKEGQDSICSYNFSDQDEAKVKCYLEH